MADLGSSKVPDLNVPSERATKELPEHSFTFENGHSKLKVWALEVIVAPDTALPYKHTQVLRVIRFVNFANFFLLTRRFLEHVVH